VMSPESDVKALADQLVGEQQRLTTVSSFHLRAFLAESGLGAQGVDEATLADAIRARGGRVLRSPLAVPQPISPTLAQSLRNQWMHWFYGDALARYGKHLAVRDHIDRNAWMTPLERDDRDAKIYAIVDALMAPIVRDYRTAATHIELSPGELVRTNPHAHLPHLEDAFSALAANAHLVEAFRATLARGEEVVS
jgi:fatty acyl-CoA reductase